jgi:hypothetical protein
MEVEKALNNGAYGYKDKVIGGKTESINNLTANVQ